MTGTESVAGRYGPPVRGWLVVVVAGAVLAVPGLAMAYQHVYRVSLFDPDGLPENLAACGRGFRASDAPAITDAQAAATWPGNDFRPIATFAPPLHRSMTVLGLPDAPACGTIVLLRRPDGLLASYALQGGP